MTDQETAHLAAIAGQARSPDSGGDFYLNVFGPKVPGNVDDDSTLGNGPGRLKDEISQKGKVFLGNPDQASTNIGDTELKKRITQAGKKRQQDDSSNIMKTPAMKLAVTKSSTSYKNNKGQLNNEAASNKADLYISKDVLSKLAENIDSPIKVPGKQQNKTRNTKINEKGARLSGSLTRQTTIAPAKKIFKSSLRRLLKSPSPILRTQHSHSAPKVQTTPKSKSVSVYRMNVDDRDNFIVNNKAENNNRSSNKNDDSFSSGLVVPATHPRSQPPALTNLIPVIDDENDRCSLQSYKSGAGQGVRGMTDSALKKELSFSRADSSDDSGCFSNLSRQSTNLHVEGSNEQSLGKEAISSGFDPQISVRKTPSVPSVCSACGNEVQSRGGGFCKNCMNRIKKESDHKGTLDEFRAYAQSIAQSVKQILTINPERRKTEDVFPEEPKKVRSKQILKQALPQAKEELRKKSHPEAVLHRYKTEMPINHPDELRARSLLNRSVSFDTNIVAELDGNDVKSPTYWANNDHRRKLSNSSTTLFDSKLSEEDPLRKAVVRRGDQFASDMRGKSMMTFEEDKFVKVDKMRRKITRSKVSGKYDKGKLAVDSASAYYMNSSVVSLATDNRPPLPPAAGRGDDEFKTLVQSSYNPKHRSKVERAKTDGDLLSNTLHQDVPSKHLGKAEQHKRPEEVHRSASKTLRKADSELDETGKYSYKQEKEKVNTLKISRLKVIHEGSPVDPPYNTAKTKSEDTKARRTALIRSATAPYRNHAVKRDTFSTDKPVTSESTIKANKSLAKLAIRTNKASSLRKESSMKEMKERDRPTAFVPILASEPWKEDGPKSSIIPGSKRRSTSYDGNIVYSRRIDVQRSKSRSAIDDDDVESKQRREPVSTASNFRRKVKINEGGIGIPSPRTIAKFRDNLTGFVSGTVPADKSHRSEVFTDTVAKYRAPENAVSELFFDQRVIAEVDKLPIKELGASSEVHSKSAYYDGPLCYAAEMRKRASPPMETKAVMKSKKPERGGNDGEFYFCYNDANPAVNSPALRKKMLSHDSSDIRSLVKVGGEDEIYHDKLEKYAVRNDAPEDNDTLWYMPIQERCGSEKALLPRDRSHESKSSTSFHVIATVKSSHSDVALMRHQSALEHSGLRRQSIYSESDVDTGVIYHFAKRQTTRAHVPPYHELTVGAPKGIYTMSGDVSRSESSNSAVSIKSEVSDSLYTGGFFKNDPFYDNDTKGNSSSESSSSHIYFEPEGATKQEASENDIYTGGVFSSSQNALSLGNQADADSTNHGYEALQDGSMNNSTRPPVGRMSRRLRYNRPSIDAFGVRSTGSAIDTGSRSVVPVDIIQFSNWSNNSNYWIDVKGTEPSGLSCTRTAVILSDESLYTDYEPGSRPEFQVKQYEKFVPGPDFSKHDIAKYEIQDATTSTGFFFSSPPKSEGDDEWYRGPFGDSLRKAEFQSGNRAPRPLNVPRVGIQEETDDYTYMGPKFRDTNNCNGATYMGNAQNSNNNHFEDCYTGNYGAANTQPSFFGQPNSSRPNSSSGVYEQAPPRYSQSNFYDSDYAPQNNQSSTTLYEQASEAYASSTYSQSRSCPYEVGNENTSHWGEYDPKASSSTSNLYGDGYECKPSRGRSEERDSYFQYISSRSPGSCSYVEEDESYLGENRKMSDTFETSPIIKEIKRVGGIVCRENVANKEDYAEDVNRDLEPAAWVPFNYRRMDEEIKHPSEMGGSRTTKSEVFGTAEITNTERYGSPSKNIEDSAYAHNRIYDNLGARNKWREMAAKRDAEMSTSGSLPSNRFQQSMGDHAVVKKEHPNKAAWMPPDQIPDRARGKRVTTNAPPPGPTVLDSNNANDNGAGNSRHKSLPPTTLCPKKPVCPGAPAVARKWRKVVIEYPRPSPKPLPAKTQVSEKATYKATVLRLGDTLSIAVRKEQTSEKTRQDLEEDENKSLPTVKPLPNIFHKTSKVQTDEFESEIQDLLASRRTVVPLHFPYTATWTMLEDSGSSTRIRKKKSDLSDGETTGTWEEKTNIESEKGLPDANNNSESDKAFREGISTPVSRNGHVNESVEKADHEAGEETKKIEPVDADNKGSKETSESLPSLADTDAECRGAANTSEDIVACKKQRTQSMVTSSNRGSSCSHDNPRLDSPKETGLIEKVSREKMGATCNIGETTRNDGGASSDGGIASDETGGTVESNKRECTESAGEASGGEKEGQVGGTIPTIANGMDPARCEVGSDETALGMHIDDDDGFESGHDWTDRRSCEPRKEDELHQRLKESNEETWPGNSENDSSEVRADLHNEVGTSKGKVASRNLVSFGDRNVNGKHAVPSMGMAARSLKRWENEVKPLIAVIWDENDRERYEIIKRQLVTAEKIQRAPVRKREKRACTLFSIPELEIKNSNYE